MEPREILYTLCIQQGITRPELVRRLRLHGLSSARQRVHNYWIGKRVPDPEAAHLICHALDLTVGDCLRFYRACGIPLPDPIWEELHWPGAR